MPVIKHVSVGAHRPRRDGAQPAWAHPARPEKTPQRARRGRQGCSVTVYRGREGGRKGLKEAKHPQPCPARPGLAHRPVPPRDSAGPKPAASPPRLAVSCHAILRTVPRALPRPYLLRCRCRHQPARPGPAQLRLPPSAPVGPAAPQHGGLPRPRAGHDGNALRPPLRTHTGSGRARRHGNGPVTSHPGHDIIAGAPGSVSLLGGHRAGDCWVSEKPLESLRRFLGPQEGSFGPWGELLGPSRILLVPGGRGCMCF